MYEAAVRSRCWPRQTTSRSKLQTLGSNPHPYVGEYESVALAFRVIPHEEGIALRVRGKVRFYDTDTLEESAPVPLRPIRDGHFTTRQGFVTFLNPGVDGRMQHLAARRRLHKRSG